MNSMFRVQLLGNRLSLSSRVNCSSTHFGKGCFRSPIQFITINKFSTSVDSKNEQFRKRLDVFLRDGKTTLLAGKWLQAESFYVSAEQAAMLVKDNDALVESHYNLGYSSLCLKKYDKSASYFKKAIPELKTKNPQLYVLANSYCAESEAKQDHFEEAITLAKEALRVAKENKNSENPLLIPTLQMNLASYLGSTKSFDEAITVGEEALDGFTKVLGRHNDTTKQAGSNLAKTYKDSGNDAKLKDLVENWSKPTLEKVKDWESKGESLLNEQDVEKLKAIWKKEPVHELDLPGFVLPDFIAEKQRASLGKLN